MLHGYLVVGADIECDWQTAARCYTSTRRVQSQLAYRYAHAIRAQVTKSKDSLSVCHYNCLHQ